MQRFLRRAAQCRHPLFPSPSPRRANSSRPPFIPPSQQILFQRREKPFGLDDLELKDLDELDPDEINAEKASKKRRDEASEQPEQEQEDEDSDSDEGLDRLAKEVEDEFGPREKQTKPRPQSPAFYTGRAAFYDQLTQIESAVRHTRSALQMLQLLPLPDFAREGLPQKSAIWKSNKEVAADLGVPMSSARYRMLTRQLSTLSGYLTIAEAAGADDLATSARTLISLFESPVKEAALSRGQRNKIFTDQLGRSYTFGKRKTSTARVWMIPVPKQSPPRLERIDLEKIASLDEAEALLKSQPERFEEPQAVPTAHILINNIPLGEFFATTAERERVVRPLKVAGLLNAYNIFTLVRGGGTTGQSGALAHGIAKGLVVHQPGLETLLRRTKLLRRDPRMVERKKPGKAKARKAYAWVKR